MGKMGEMRMQMQHMSPTFPENRRWSNEDIALGWAFA